MAATKSSLHCAKPSWILLLVCTFLLCSHLGATASGEVQHEDRQLTSSAPSTLGDNLERRTLEHDGLIRHFLERRPDSFVAGSSGVLILLHGGTQSMVDIFEDSQPGTRRWLTVSDSAGFLLLAPNGIEKRRLFFGLGQEVTITDGDSQNWNDLRSDVDLSDADDVGFLAALVQWAIDERQVDASKVYITGASNGGMMTHRMLLERPELFAAGASTISNLPVSPVPMPASPRPILLMNGDADPIVPWEGGTVRRNRGVVRSALATRDFFVMLNGAVASSTDMLPDTDPGDGCRITREEFSSTTPVAFLTMVGGGHVYATTDEPQLGFFVSIINRIFNLTGNFCNDADFADLAWDFMSQHSL